MKKLMYLLILMLISISMDAVTHASTIVTDGLVSYWTFDHNNIDDEIIEDVWGKNDATIKGNPKITGGYLRQGLELNGAGDYVVLANIGNVQSRIGPSTIELWVKLSNNKKYGTLFKVLEPPCSEINRGWGLDINAVLKQPENKIIYSQGDMLLQISQIQKPLGCSASSTSFHFPISDGEWHHIVFVAEALYIDETGKEWKANNIYIDNILLFFGRYSTEIPDNFTPYTQPIYIGATNDNGRARSYFRGVIDEVRVYNRALTHDDVTQNFASHDGLAVEPPQKLPIVWGELKTSH